MKKYFLGIAAVLIAVVMTAFSNTVDTPKTLAGEKWYELNAGGNPMSANDYSLFGDGSSAPPCPGGTTVCAKLAVPDQQDPDIPNLNTTIDTRHRTTP